jgi:hypothetical protein
MVDERENEIRALGHELRNRLHALERQLDETREDLNTTREDLNAMAETQGAWDDWKTAHTGACQGIIDWLQSLELDRLVDMTRRDGRAHEMLRRIWHRDASLRPPALVAVGLLISAAEALRDVFIGRGAGPPV